MSVKHTVIY